MTAYEGISLTDMPTIDKVDEKLLNRLARECHAANQTWWHDPATGERITRNKNELMMLVVSEIAEAMEGERKNLMDDKLPHRKMAEVELADALIRIFDLAGAFHYDLDIDLNASDTLNGYAKIFSGIIRVDAANKAAELLHIVRDCCRVNFSYHESEISYRLQNVVTSILAYAGAYGYDMDGAVTEKRAFNAQRADHKPENRLKAGGKKW